MTITEQAIPTTFSLGVEGNALQTDQTTLLGAGSRIGFDHAIAERFSITATASFAFQANKKPGAYLYSGMSGTIRYALLGTSMKTQTTVLNNQNPVVIYRRSTKNSLWVGGGLEQLFLNGTANVYPAVGPTGQLGYTFHALGLEFCADVKGSFLIANDRKMYVFGAGFGVNLDI